MLRYEGLEPLEPRDPNDFLQRQEAARNQRIFGLLGELWRRVHGVLGEFRVKADATPVQTHHVDPFEDDGYEEHSYRFDAALRCPLFTARLHFVYTRSVSGPYADVYRESLRYRLDQMAVADGAAIRPVDFDLFTDLYRTQGAGVAPVVADIVARLRPALLENRYHLIRPVFAARADSVFNALPSIPRDHVAQLFRESLERDVERWLH